MSERFEIEVYAYVLMNNHYHLLLKTNKPNISKGMQWFGTTYTRRYNVKHKRNGHLFQGRFKNFLVENDEYLMLLSCYIHRNPQAGIVRRLVDYPWSSYPVYAYGKNHQSGYVQRLFFLILIQKTRTEHTEIWFKDIPGKKKRLWEDFRHGLFWDHRSLLTVSGPNICPKKPDVEIPQKRQVLRDTNPKTILEKAAKILKCNTNDFLQSSRISDSNKLNRDLLIYLLWSTGWYNNQEIGNLFGLGYSSISRRVTIMKSMILKEGEMNKRLENIKSLINRLSENTFARLVLYYIL